MSSAGDDEELLVRAAEVVLRSLPDGSAFLRVGSSEAAVSHHTLAILDAFDRPRTIRDAAARLPAQGGRDFIDLTTTIFKLRAAGVLVSVAGDPAAWSIDTGFDASPIHVRMLRDRRRTASFIAALREVVRPDDVVVDIGTGTGVLAIAAAHAGASSVFAIESGEIAARAEAVVRANGLTDRVHVVRGRSTRVRLPEPCSVLVTETLGDDPFGEGLLETVDDAKRRLLRPDARLIPSAVRLFATAVMAGPRLADDWFFTPENLDRFRADYGIDFGSFAVAEPTFVKLTLDETRDLTPLAPPAPLVEVDLTTAFTPRLEASGDATLHTAGTLDGVLLHFDAQLSPSERLDAAPANADADHHWQYVCWLQPRRTRVRAGDALALSYRYVDGTSRLDVAVR